MARNLTSETSSANKINPAIGLLLAANLKKIISEKGLNQKEFGDLIGAAPSQVSSWLKCKKMPAWKTFEDFCDALDVTPSEMLASNRDSEAHIAYSALKKFAKTLVTKNGRKKRKMANG